MCQSHSPPASTEAAVSAGRSDSQTAVDTSVEQFDDNLPNPQGDWVVDTITLAEYEAQLKAQSETVADPSVDSTSEAAADAYFDQFSSEEVDASIVLDKEKMSSIEGDEEVGESLTAVSDSTVPASPGTIPNPDYATRSIAETEQAVTAVDKVPFGAQTTPKDGPVAKVIQPSNSDWTAPLNGEMSTPILLAVSLGLAFLVVVFLWNIGRFLSWLTLRRQNHVLQQYADPYNDNWRNEEDSGSDSQTRQEHASTRDDGTSEGLKKRATFKKVVYPKRTSPVGDGVAPSNSLLESELLNAKESLALVKANSQLRTSELQAKAKKLDKQLSAKDIEVQQLQSDLLKAKSALAAQQSQSQQLQAKANSLESQLKGKSDEFSNLQTQLKEDLRISNEKLATSQADADSCRAELLEEVGLLQEQLNNKSLEISKLKSDSLASDETIAVIKAKADEREKKLLVDLEVLGDEVSAKTEDLSSLEAELTRTQESLESHIESQSELQQAHQTQVESLEQNLRSQSETISQLETDLSTAEATLAAAESQEQERVNELRAKLEQAESELTEREVTLAKHEADLNAAEQSHTDYVQCEAERMTKLEAKSEALKQKLVTRNAAFSKLKSKWLASKKTLAKTQAKLTEMEAQSQDSVDQIGAEISTEKVASGEHEEAVVAMKKARADQTSDQSRRIEELEKKLAASKSKVSNLKERLANAAVNRNNYMKLAKKVVGYKRLYRSNEERVNELVKENMRLSDLVSDSSKAGAEYTIQASALVTPNGQTDDSVPDFNRPNNPR